MQWLYFGYLAAVKEQNGAAMSLGRVSTFLDVYFERDLQNGTLTEAQAQEIIDDFVIKLRIVRFLRTPEYDELFAGDPTWVTESIGGMGDDGRPLVTKTSFRVLQTLYNLGPAPEPNLTIWYSPRLPDGFRRFAAKVAIDTSSLQFESDEMMRRALRRRRRHRLLRLAHDGRASRCSSSAPGPTWPSACSTPSTAAATRSAGEQVGPRLPPLEGDVLTLEDVAERLERMMDWLAERVRQRHERDPLHARQVRL